MLTYILRRAALIVPTFFGVTLLAFALIHLIPGDPVENLSGERGMAPERRERLLHEYGLDRPLTTQYAVYVRQVLKGDLGSSLTTHEPVLDEFLTLFPATVELAFFAMLLAVCVGLPAGIIAALKRNTVADYAVMGVSLTGYSMPIFWWALLLILFFSVHLGWTPVSGRIAVEFDVPASTGLMLIDTLRSGEPGFQLRQRRAITIAGFARLGDRPRHAVSLGQRRSSRRPQLPQLLSDGRHRGVGFMELGQRCVGAR